MKHSVLRDSLLSGAFVSLVVLASPIRAQDAGQKLDIQLLPPIQGKSYDMPAGDFSAEVKAEAAARLRLVPRRTLNPDQLKDQGRPRRSCHKRPCGYGGQSGASEGRHPQVRHQLVHELCAVRHPRRGHAESSCGRDQRPSRLV